jgi:hypothetical protein
LYGESAAWSNEQNEWGAGGLFIGKADFKFNNHNDLRDLSHFPASRTMAQKTDH